MQEKLPQSVIQYLEIGRLFLQLTGWGHHGTPRGNSLWENGSRVRPAIPPHPHAEKNHTRYLLLC
jgi:hypothetical protein